MGGKHTQSHCNIDWCNQKGYVGEGEAMWEMKSSSLLMLASIQQELSKTDVNEKHCKHVTLKYGKYSQYKPLSPAWFSNRYVHTWITREQSKQKLHSCLAKELAKVPWCPATPPSSYEYPPNHSHHNYIQILNVRFWWCKNLIKVSQFATLF